ncbi:MAG: hypothetical protein RL684_1990 [Pseudomonadota bacterium]|jgi:hypothetical protein
MANFKGTVATLVAAAASGQPLVNRAKTNLLNGRLRIFESMFVAPASGTAPAIADKIIWGKLPLKARLIGHLTKLYWNTGTAACTINLGDSLLATRHVAATAINATGSVICDNAALIGTAIGDVTINSAVIQNVKAIGAFIIGGIVTGTGIPAGTTVTGIDYISKTVTLSAVATATNATVTLTDNGGDFEVNDDSNNEANSYGSTTDDATLISVVAGAQIANNQVITLKAVYVQD